MRLTTRQGCCPSSDQRFALPEAARRPSPTPRLALHLATFLLATGRQLQGRKVRCFEQSTLRRVVSHRGYLHARPHAHTTGQLPSTAERPIHLVPLPYDPTTLAAFSRSSDPIADVAVQHLRALPVRAWAVLRVGVPTVEGAAVASDVGEAVADAIRVNEISLDGTEVVMPKIAVPSGPLHGLGVRIVDSGETADTLTSTGTDRAPANDDESVVASSSYRIRR